MQYATTRKLLVLIFTSTFVFAAGIDLIKFPIKPTMQKQGADIIFANGFEDSTPPVAPVILLSPPSIVTSPALADPINDSVGATQGSFKVDESGAANYSFPIMTPPGTGGLTPSIRLEYSSLSGNGIAGVGWNLTGVSSITRCLHSIESDGIGAEVRTVSYTNDDAYCMNGQRLFINNNRSNGDDLAEYKTEIDGFDLIKSLGTVGNGPATFEVRGKDGLLRTYGTATNSNANVNAGNNTINTWLLASIKDKYNNEIRYIWDNKTNNNPYIGEVLLDKIQWTFATNIKNSSGNKVAKYELDLSYAPRTDKSSLYSYGSHTISQQRLTDITLSTRKTSNSGLIELRNYMLIYDDEISPSSASPTGISRLESISECVASTCLAPVKFEYTQTLIGHTNLINSGGTDFTGVGYSLTTKMNQRLGSSYIDINGDGRYEMLYLSATDPTALGGGDFRYRFYLAIRTDDPSWTCPLTTCPTSNTLGFYKTAFDQAIVPIANTSGANPRKYDDSHWGIMDYNGDSYQDLIARSSASGTWMVYLSNGTRLCPNTLESGCSNYTPINSNIPANEAFHSINLMDFNADGLADMGVPTSQGGNFIFAYHQLNRQNSTTLPYIFDTNVTVIGIDKTGLPNFNNPISTGYDLRTFQKSTVDLNGDGYNDVIIQIVQRFENEVCGQLGGGLNQTQVSDNQWPYYHLIKADEEPAPQTINALDNNTCLSASWWSFVFDPNFNDLSDANNPNNGKPVFVPYSEIGKIYHDPAWTPTSGQGGLISDSGGAIRVIDLNGDGLSDILMRNHQDVAPKTWHYRINTGKQLLVVNSFDIEATTPYKDIQKNVFFVDYDFDGDVDVLYPETSSNDIKYFKLRKFNYCGTGVCAAYTENEITNLVASKGSNSDNYSHQFFDFNGDGNFDHILYDINSARVAFGKTPWQAKDKIEKIIVGQYDNAQSAPISVTNLIYESALLPTVYTAGKKSYNLQYGNGSPIFDLTMPQYLVRKVETSLPADANIFNSGPNNTAKMLYHYSGLKVQGGGRGYLGFESVMTHDLQHDTSSITFYHQDFPYIGMPKDTYVYNNTVISNIATEILSCGGGNQYAGNCAITVCDVLTDTNQCFINNSTFPTAINLYQDKAMSSPLNAILISHKNNQYNQAISNPIAASLLVYVDKSTEKYWELSSDEFYSRTETTYSYNAADRVYGNISTSAVKTFDTEFGASAISSKSTVNTYKPADTTNWVIGRLQDSTITQSRTQDNSPDNVSTAQFIYNAKGQITKQSVDGATASNNKAADTNQQLFTRHIYDNTYGNEILTINCSNNVNCDAITSTTTVPVIQTDPLKILNYIQKTYDDDWQLFVKDTSTHFGSSNTANAQKVITTTVLSRDNYGNPTQVRDIFGNISTNAYGIFGDLQASSTVTGGHSLSKRRWCNSNASNANEVNYCPAAASMVAITETKGSATTRSFVDQLGREVRKQSQDMNGNWITVDTTYDKANRVRTLTQPYIIDANTGTSSSIYKTTTNYDQANRIIQVNSPTFCSNGVSTCNGTTNIDYAIVNKQLVTTTTNPKLQTRTEYTDGSGKIVKIEDALSNPIQYGYNDRGDLTSITSYKSIINGDTSTPITITMEYDEYGRKTSMNDPDKGSWTYSYNARGNLLTQSDGKGQITTFSYDMNGRKISETSIGDRNFAGNWYYDENGDYGLLSRETETGQSSQQISKVYYYDAYGRTSEQVTDITDSENNTTANYSQKTNYDQHGRIFSSIDATGYGQLFQYNNYGYQTKILEAAVCISPSSNCHNFIFGNNIPNSSSSHQVYYEAINSDAYGNIISSVHHNNISKITDYDPRTGLPWQITTGNGTIQNQNFKFNELGNLVERTNISNATNEAFQYDDLNRLQTTNRYINSNFGIINQSESNAYDTTGNLTSKNGTSQSYNPTTSNKAGPHAITSVGIKKYIYDNNGNIDYSTGGVTNKTYRYMAFDKAHQITMTGAKYHQSQFRYDANKSRYYRKDTDDYAQTTIKHYIGNVEKHHKSSGISYKRYIGNSLVITMPTTIATQDQWDYDYLFKNHIGSVDVITDETGTLKETLSFNSWGQRQTPNDLNPIVQTNILAQLQTTITITDRGYTGHEQLDGLGLIHMNGRIYDPYIGRFTQADPIIQDPYNTQSLNRYTYVLNNPLTLTDPTGYFSIKRFWNKTGRTIAAIGITVLSSGAASGWFGTLATGQKVAIIFTGGFAAGGVASGNLKGAIKGGIFAALTYGIAHGAKGAGWVKEGLGRSLAHASLAGVSAVIDDGNFGIGFTASFLSTYADKFGLTDFDSLTARIIANSLVAGTISEVTGGKFANGALSAAFRVAFNDTLEEATAKARTQNRDAMKLQVGYDREYTANQKLINSEDDALTYIYYNEKTEEYSTSGVFSHRATDTQWPTGEGLTNSGLSLTPPHPTISTIGSFFWGRETITDVVFTAKYRGLDRYYSKFKSMSTQIEGKVIVDFEGVRRYQRTPIAETIYYSNGKRETK